MYYTPNIFFEVLLLNYNTYIYLHEGYYKITYLFYIVKNIYTAPYNNILLGA